MTYRDPWPSLADMLTDTCSGCADMGAALRWDDAGRVYVWICECKQNGETMNGVTWEAKPITADALGGEWQPTGDVPLMEQYTLYVRDNNYVHVARWHEGEWHVVVGNEYGEGTEFLGVKTMSDLRTLVRLLGGAE